MSEKSRGSPERVFYANEAEFAAGNNNQNHLSRVLSGWSMIPGQSSSPRPLTKDRRLELNHGKFISAIRQDKRRYLAGSKAVVLSLAFAHWIRRSNWVSNP